MFFACLWEKLDIGTVERRKILCNVTFHIVVLICIIWSLYVLIERTAVEIRDSSLEWPFWTKLVVMAIGFTGCTVLVYVQWRTYVRLFKRWRAYNRVIFVQNGPSVHKGEVGGAAMVMADAGQRSGATKQPTQTTASRAQTTTTMVVEIK
uniref:Uncharacterized protein n=1 Tax=Romanomermis culicivorax TaxID=13658 RepID=A0A915JZH5_ROMCU